MTNLSPTSDENRTDSLPLRPGRARVGVDMTRYPPTFILPRKVGDNVLNYFPLTPGLFGTLNSRHWSLPEISCLSFGASPYWPLAALMA